MQEKQFDIVIIGSGAGGGAAAQELSGLCKDGVRIGLLEWGPKFRESDYTGQELEMAQKLYFDGGGVLTKDKSMTLAFAKAYGGSTVVYTGTSLTILKETVARWGVPGITWEDLKERSKKYISQNNVHLLEEDKINDNNALFRDGCRKLGYRVEQFPVNVKGCQGSGMCNLGCPNAAKQGTHRVQLPAAEKNGVQVVTSCKVERIGDRVLEAVVADAGVGHPSAWAPGRYRVRAKVIVVAAGAVNSPALLLRSGFGRSLPALGRYFTCHPALILVGQHEKPITNYYGHPKSFYSDHFAESGHFLLETCMYFPFTTAKNLAGFGPEHSRFMSRMDLLQMILVLAIDEAAADNRISVDGSGNPVVDYTLTSATLDSLYESMKVCAKIFFAAGAAAVHAPAGKKFLIKAEEAGRLDEFITRDELKTGKVSIAAAHLMGGCRVGENSAGSVTNVWGRVHGVPWLYVADASLFPKAAEINPYVTIMAMADRSAEDIRRRAPQLLN
ncbi:MAG: GMC family oxidoreductase [Elusimicrobia bacterium]|nr:GMC family oxidoreductase [Elusimicrobiota bacterium]